jgi:outer membrane immunogenic protein
MRKLVTAVLACALTTSAAQIACAADMAAPVYKAPPTPVFSWTGFYAGLNAGYGWANFSDGFGDSENLNGFVGGGQIGANYQTGPFVLGIEADIQGTTQSNSSTFSILGQSVREKDSLPWFGTVRGRVGYAWDRWMLYGTGGWAYMQTKVDLTSAGTVSSSSNNSGWTAGAGVEWAMWDHWSTKLEYLYIDTGNTTFNLFGAPLNGRGKDNVVRAGFNYRF